MILGLNMWPMELDAVHMSDIILWCRLKKVSGELLNYLPGFSGKGIAWNNRLLTRSGQPISARRDAPCTCW